MLLGVKTLAFQLVCLYLETFRIYSASKLTMLENIQKFNIFGLSEESRWLPAITYSFHGQHLPRR